MRRAAVIARPAPVGGAQLLAFAQPVTEGGPVDGAELLAAVRPWLPEQAVPSVLRLVDGFPLDANGKIDRAALLKAEEAEAQQGAERSVGSGADGAATPTERTLLRICAGLLGRSDLDPSDNFLDAGGTSVTAARLLAALEEEFGVRLKAPVLLRQPDLRAVARLVDERRPGAAAG